MKIFITILLSLSVSTAFAQVPYIDTVEVLPAGPYKNDHIKLALKLLTSNTSRNLDLSYHTSNDTIKIEACYQEYLTHMVVFYNDTFDVGPLDDGPYVVQVKGYISDDSPCHPVDSNEKFFFFRVLPPVGINTLSANEGPTIYPNPASDALYIRKKDLRISSAYVKDMQGRILQQYADADQINISKLPAGIYLLELETDKGVVRRRFVKE